MYILDANILIYAFREDAPFHQACYDWLTNALAQGEDVTAPSVVELALLRITTLPSLKEAAATPSAVFSFLQALRQTSYRRLEPGAAHDAHLQELCDSLKLRGNDVNDAFLVALALEHNAILVSADQGFKRFPMIQVVDPTKPGTSR